MCVCVCEKKNLSLVSVFALESVGGTTRKLFSI